MATTDKPASILIALRFFETGGRPFDPCDRFDRKDFPRISDRRIMQMTEARYIAPLSPDSYAKAARIYGEGHIGKGFTREGLINMGILPADAPKAEKKAAPKVEKTVTEPAPEDPPKKVETPPQSIIDGGYDVVELHNGYWLAGQKRGVSTRFDIFDAAGARLNPGKTENGIKKARAEADRMLSVAKANAASNPDKDDGAEETETRTEGLTGGLMVWTGPQSVASGAETKENATAWTDDTGAVFMGGKFVQSVEASGIDSMSDEDLKVLLEKNGLSVGENDDRTVMISMAKMLDLSTGANASDTSDAEQQKEGGDGSNIQSGDDGTEGSGSPEDR